MTRPDSRRHARPLPRSRPARPRAGATWLGVCAVWGLSGSALAQDYGDHEPLAPAPARDAPALQRRQKPLQITVGRSPTSLDVGNEADLMAVGDEEISALPLDDWSFNFKGYLRAGVGASLGPRNDGESGSQLHTPPRIVGGSSGRWEYASLSQNPAMSLYVNFSNPRVSANVIMSSGTLADSSFDGNLDRISPGVRQAYLILKWPDAFSHHGGLALTVGGFSNRYGSAGREQVSSGYYGAYLFGRTHVAGETLAADIDLTPDTELVLEHGLGAKLESIPFLREELVDELDRDEMIQADVTELDYFEGQGQVPQGSNFLHHAHAGIFHGGWLMLAAHYLTSWTPNDNALSMRGERVREGRATAVGGEIHIDGDAIGNGYLGYSHIIAENLQPLGNALQLPHGSTGRSFKESFFGARTPDSTLTPRNDTGTVDTVLFQYSLSLAQYLGRLPFGARELRAALYSMFNHAVSPKTNPDDSTELDVDTYKLKFGTELQVDLLSFLTLATQFDVVQPDLSDAALGYTAITPKVIFRTTWATKERVMLTYSHFFLGERAFPSSPFNNLFEADSDLFTLTAIISF